MLPTVGAHSCIFVRKKIRNERKINKLQVFVSMTLLDPVRTLSEAMSTGNSSLTYSVEQVLTRW